MNSRDRVDNNISFMFNASNIRWHIVMKGRVTITAFDKNEAKKTNKKKKEKKRSLTRTWLVQRAKSAIISRCLFTFFNNLSIL